MIAAALFACRPASLEPVARGLKPAEVERDRSCKMISFGDKRGISNPFRQRDCLLDEACGSAQVAAHLPFYKAADYLEEAEWELRTKRHARWRTWAEVMLNEGLRILGRC